MSTDLCMIPKAQLSELVRDIIKDLLAQIDGVKIKKTVLSLSLENSGDPLEDFLRLEIFLEKLKYFDLMITLRDCWRIDIEGIISNSRNGIMTLAYEVPKESIETIFSKDSSEKREEFKKFLDANLSLCKKILDLSRLQPE